MKTNFFLVVSFSLLLLSVCETEATPDKEAKNANQKTTTKANNETASGPSISIKFLSKFHFVGSASGGAFVLLVSTLAYILIKT